MPGPYVQMAAICEKVLQEADGVLTAVRIVDRFMISAQALEGEAPDELPAGGQFAITLLVMLKADDARGRHPVTIKIQHPSGPYLPAKTFDALFEGEERGVNLILNLQLEAEEGIYWFEVWVSSRMLTRIPLRLMYRRVPTGA